jgi:hypothetical protein
VAFAQRPRVGCIYFLFFCSGLGLLKTGDAVLTNAVQAKIDKTQVEIGQSSNEITAKKLGRIDFRYPAQKSNPCEGELLRR